VSLSLAENRLFLRYISLKKSTADLIEIMVLVKDQFNDNPDKYRINKYRNNALNEIAHRRNRERNTIANAYIRGYQINGTSNFQRYLEDWILNKSNELIDIVTRFIPEREREDVIAILQGKKTEVQKLLDYEVMDSISQSKYPEGRSKIDIHLTKERKQQLVYDAKHKGVKSTLVSC